MLSYKVSLSQTFFESVSSFIIIIINNNNNNKNKNKNKNNNNNNIECSLVWGRASPQTKSVKKEKPYKESDATGLKVYYKYI